MISSGKISFLRKLTPMALSQFLGVFNDHAFKMTSVLAAIAIADDSYSDDAAFLALLTIVYVAPFLGFANPAGYLADRFPKRRIMIAAKFAELLIMLLGALCFWRVDAWGIMPLVGVMFLMAAQSAFFSPALNGALPEVFSERDLSHANGDIGMATNMAVILGVAGGFLFKKWLGDSLLNCGLLLSGTAFVGFIAILRAPFTPAANTNRRWCWNFIGEYIRGLSMIFRQRPLLLAFLADAFFLALGISIQSVLVIYGKYSLGIPKNDEIAIGILQLAPALGIALGAYLAGRLSGDKVELGLVPFGGLGFFLMLLGLAFAPVWGFELWGSLIFPLHLALLIALGISGGLYVVPLRAFEQKTADPVHRGTIMANSNVICFSAILLSGVVMFLLTAGGDAGGIEGGFFAQAKSCCLNLTPRQVVLGMAVATFAACGALFYLLPDFAMRFFIFILVHTVYKLRVKGVENIPDRGPALLVANHASFVDGLLIIAGSSRFVRFMMHEDYYKHPLLHHFVKWAGFIPVPDPGQPKKIMAMFKAAGDALRDGDVVCVFPEGKITRNGIMDEFKQGLARIIPDDVEAPVIPVRLGMLWGSIFSYYYGKIKMRIPEELPHPASVTFGTAIDKHTPPFEIRQKLSELAADTEMDARKEERPIHCQFARIAKRRPRLNSFHDFDGESPSNLETFIRAIALAKIIRVKTVGQATDFIGVLLPNRCVSAAATLAVLIADKIPAMLNFTASAESIDHCLKKAGVQTILTSRQFIAKAKITPRPEMVFLEDMVKDIGKMDKVCAFLLAKCLPAKILMKLLSPLSRADVFRPAVVLFSSGSTGVPKGVMLSHHNINSNVHAFFRIAGLDPRTEALVGNLPLFHSFGFTTLFWIPLMTGARVSYIVNPLDAEQTGRAIAEDKLTVLLATPTFLQAYMRKCDPKVFKTLRLVIVGAEKLRRDIADRFKEVTGLTPIEGYGCTETSPVVSINIANSFLDLGIKSGPFGSIGKAMPGIAVKIVDPDSGERLPPGAAGLMLVKGPNIMMGYLNDPELTAKSIVDGWYDTGDMAKMDVDGRISITGRRSRFSKIGGEMVPHELIEGRINELIGAERTTVAVAAAPDPVKGEKLVVIFDESAGIEPADIVLKLRGTGLPNLWIPKAGDFYPVEKLPILGSGKLDVKAVRAMAASF